MLTPTLFLLSIITYIVASIFTTRYLINGGKSEKDIIFDNKMRQQKSKDFKIKYPEADTKRARNYILAFGFIFAFTSSIFAFKVLGGMPLSNPIGKLEVEPTDIIAIMQPVSTERAQEKVKEVPPPPKSTTVIVKTIDDNKVELPNIDDPKEIVPENKKVIFEIPKGKEKVEPVPTKSFAEKMPKYKGCEDMSETAAYECTMSKIQAYIAKIGYPERAFRDEKEAKVYVSFVIGENGEVENVKIESKPNPYFDKEAVKYLQSLPTFANAGMQGGKTVKVRFTVPIDFKLVD